MMQIDAADLVKIVTGCASLGGGLAFAKPFAGKLFDNYLERSKQRAMITDRKETAIERVVAQNERFIGVLERIDATLDRQFRNVDARLDRLEAHLGIKPSTPPPLAEAPHEPTRRQLTDPDLSRAALLPGEPSAPTSSRGR
jgi:hypothetical protein